MVFIIVHGGASKISTEHHEFLLKGVEEAAKIAFETLKYGGSSIDAVEAAIVSMENNPIFNAGKGSSLTMKKEIEMDALIMRGSDYKIGAVIGIKNYQNPVKIARLVMDRTSHCIITGQYAEELAQNYGYNLLENQENLITELSMRNFLNTSDYNRVICHEVKKEMIPKNLDNGSDTVGAIAIDSNGVISCALSTGGLNRKLSGRVGDVPCPGCGAYASNVGGAVATGDGEALMKTTISRQALYYMEQGMHPKEAAKKAIENTYQKVGGIGGILCVDKDSEFGVYFNSCNMPWAKIGSDGKVYSSVTEKTC